MPVSNIKATFQCDSKILWGIIADISKYPHWRSDLSRVDILDGKRFVEYTKNGFLTTFTTTLFEPYHRWEFDLENSNMSGHWTGIFTQKGNQTTVSFTEDVTVKKWLLKPLVKGYLKKQQTQFVADLKKELEKTKTDNL